MNSIPPGLQRLLDTHMSTEEQIAWRQNSTRTTQGLADMKAYARAQQEEVFTPLKALMDAGAQPTSPDVQRLVDHNNQLMTRYSVRDRLVKVYESNPSNFGKVLNVGRDLMRAMKQDRTQFGSLIADVDVIAFFLSSSRCVAA